MDTREASAPAAAWTARGAWARACGDSAWLRSCLCAPDTGDVARTGDQLAMGDSTSTSSWTSKCLEDAVLRRVVPKDATAGLGPQLCAVPAALPVFLTVSGPELVSPGRMQLTDCFPS